MKQSPAAIFAKIIRKDPEAVARVLAENVEALVGGKVNMEMVPRQGPEFASLFGDRDLYVFPLEDHHGTPFPSLLAFTIPAAVHFGGAFSLMGAAQVKEVLDSGEIPEILHDSIGEVANIICGAAVHMIRTRVAEAPQFRRGAAFGKKSVGTWPSLLAEFGPRVPWEIVACRLTVNGEDRGAIFFSASDGEQGRVTKEEIIAVAGPGPEPEPEQELDAADDVELSPGQDADPVPSPPSQGEESEPDLPDLDAPEPARPAAQAQAPSDPRLTPDIKPNDWLPDSIRALVTGHPADPAAAALRSALETTGVKVLPAFTTSADNGAPPDAMFVVSRSPVDLSIRLERFAPGRRPALVVACSDRPTRDLVMVARSGGADDFLVLPASTERLRSLLSRVPVPA